VKSPALAGFKNTQLQIPTCFLTTKEVTQDKFLERNFGARLFECGEKDWLRR
jgi:hypothetical protein